MTKINKKKQQELYIWCLNQTAAKYMGKLEQEKIDKLDSIGFDWKYYENELNKLDFDWQENKPQLEL